MTTADDINLEKEYRSTREALVNAGLEMNGSIDALYHDWHRWRRQPKTLGATDRVAIGNPDEWFARHLAQFRCLIDSVHVTARAIRSRKDDIVRAR